MTSRERTNAIVTRSHGALATPVEARSTRWLYRRDAGSDRIEAGGRLGRWARRVAQSPESEGTLAEISQTALRLAPSRSGQSCSIGLTAQRRRGNQQALMAVSLATLFAKWDYATLLIEVGGRKSDTGRCIRHTTPTIADIVTAMECDQALPVPQPLTPVLANLDVLANLGRYSFARLADSGQLIQLKRALSQRYERIIWSLPCVGGAWSVEVLGDVIDRYLVSVRRGRTNERSLTRLAQEVGRSGAAPLQVVWHA